MIPKFYNDIELIGKELSSFMERNISTNLWNYSFILGAFWNQDSKWWTNFREKSICFAHSKLSSTRVKEFPRNINEFRLFFALSEIKIQYFLQWVSLIFGDYRISNFKISFNYGDRMQRNVIVSLILCNFRISNWKYSSAMVKEFREMSMNFAYSECFLKSKC